MKEQTEGSYDQTYSNFKIPLLLKVPCVAVVENMCHFDADGKRYYPFGRGSGSQARSIS